MRRLPGTLVVLGLAILISGATAYILRFGPRYPSSDDWDQVPYLVEHTPDWGWVWRPHGDHRIPVPNLIQWVCFRVSGDYRTPSLVVTALLGGLSIQVALISARIRGRASVLDLVPALACFNFAQGFLFCGFHTTFGASTFLLGLVIAWSAARMSADRQDWSKWELAALFVVLLALSGSGTNGTLPALVLSAYFAVRLAWRAKRVDGPARIASALGAAGLASVFLLSLFILRGLPAQGPFRAQGPGEALAFAMHASVSSLGFIVIETRGLVATVAPWLSLALVVFACLLALEPIARYAHSRGTGDSEPRPTLRAARADFLAIGATILALLLALGAGRGGRRWQPDFAMHYGGVALPVIFWAYFSLVLSWRHRPARIASAMLALLLAWSYWRSIPFSKGIGVAQRERRLAFEQDLRAGTPLDEIIGRNIALLSWVDNADRRRTIRDGFLLLRAEAIRDGNRRPAVQPYRSITGAGD